MKKSRLFVLATSMMLLAACAPTTTSSANIPAVSNSETTSSNGGATSDGGTTSTTPASSNPTTSSGTSTTIDDSYLIVVRSIAGVTITPNKTKAKKGDAITLSIEVTAGYTLLSLSENKVALTITNNQASFDMPDEDVTITGSVSVSGDLTVEGGSVASALIKEGDIYVARNVKVENTTDLYYKIAGTSGYTPIAYGHINRYNCFGDITFARAEFKDATLPEGANLTEETKTESLLEVGGNAYYDFYYDPADSETPLYIQRSGVITAPNSPETYESLFAIDLYSEFASHPFGVNGVTYYDNRTGLDYTWTKYENNTSFAKVTSRLDEDAVYYDYKTIDNNVLYVVDNYKERMTTPNPYPDGGSSTIVVDDTKLEDSFAYSGKYKVVSAIDEHMGKYERTSKEAVFEANSYSHDMYSIDRMQWQSYRDSFNIADDLVKVDRKISSTVDTDGTFTTTIKSWKTYDPTASGSSAYNRMTEQVHLEYAVTTKFTKAGAPLNGSYVERKYDSTDYDFKNFAFKSGHENSTGTLVKKVNYAYTYGDPKTGTPEFDKTPYFATAITPTIKGANGTNTVTSGWRSDSESEPVSVAVTPTTALDSWEYGITASSDQSLMAPVSWNTTMWQAGLGGAGTVTLTFGNHVDTTVTGTAAIVVTANTFHSMYIYLQNGGGDDAHYAGPNACGLFSGEKWSTFIGTTPDKGCLGSMTFAYDKDVGLVCSVDPTTQKITFDATACDVKAETVVTVTLNSPYYGVYNTSTGDKWGPSVIKVTLEPRSNTKISTAYMVGNWKIESSAITSGTTDDTLVTFSDTTVTYNNKEYRKGTLALDGVTYSFYWLYDVTTYQFYITHVTEPSNQYSFLTCQATVELSTNKVGLCLYGEKIGYNSSAEQQTDTYTELLGTITTDEESGDSYTYVFFEKQA